AAVQLARGRLHLRAGREERGERRLVARLDPGQVQLLRLRVQSLDGDVQIPLERACGGFVQRELDDRPLRGDRNRGTRLRVLAGGGELLRRGTGQLCEPRAFVGALCPHQVWKAAADEEQNRSAGDE